MKGSRIKYFSGVLMILEKGKNVENVIFSVCWPLSLSYKGASGGGQYFWCVRACGIAIVHTAIIYIYYFLIN